MSFIPILIGFSFYCAVLGRGARSGYRLGSAYFTASRRVVVSIVFPVDSLFRWIGFRVVVPVGRVLE